MNPPDATSCSDSCLAAGEPLAGTASDAPLFAALSWPKTLWHADKVALSEGLPAALAELERSAKRAERKLQLRLFQRAGGAGRERVELVCADFASGQSAQLRDVALADAAPRIARFLAGEAIGPALSAPLVLVCTDGKHDACCGKLGRSLFTALRADGRVEAAESSHLGGHRLAANCLALPSGHLYGRVTPADVPELVAAIRQDRVYLPRYRGQSGLGERAQVEHAAALRGATAQCVRRTFASLSSCGDAEPEPRERWVTEPLSSG